MSQMWPRVREVDVVRRCTAPLVVRQVRPYLEHNQAHVTPLAVWQFAFILLPITFAVRR
jgi:hypothetical protein